MVAHAVINMLLFRGHFGKGSNTGATHGSGVVRDALDAGQDGVNFGEGVYSRRSHGRRPRLSNTREGRRGLVLAKRATRYMGKLAVLRLGIVVVEVEGASCG